MECAICLQKCIHPVKLPCQHIFCYLCVKGAAHQSKRCAMCRCEIPESYFDSPQLVEEVITTDTPTYDGYQWFYEGRNGWWLYDQRTSDDIEAAFKKNSEKCELLIAGFLYVIDFSRMIQYRRNEPNRMRKIKRDFPDQRDTKGVAGLRRPQPAENLSASDNGEGQTNQDQETQAPNSFLRSQLVEQLIQENHPVNDLNDLSDEEQFPTFEVDIDRISQSLLGGIPTEDSDSQELPDEAVGPETEATSRLEEMFSAQLTLEETRETYL